MSGRKKCGRKRCTTTERTAALLGLSSKIDFKNLGELHKEWTEAGVKTSRVTTHRRVEEFGYSCRQRRLTWAKEKKNWTVAQCFLFLESYEIDLYFSCTAVIEMNGNANGSLSPDITSNLFPT